MKKAFTPIYLLLIIASLWSILIPTTASAQTEFRISGMMGMPSIGNASDLDCPITGITLDLARKVPGTFIYGGMRGGSYSLGEEEWDGYYTDPDGIRKEATFHREHKLFFLEGLIRFQPDLLRVPAFHPYFELMGGGSRFGATETIMGPHPGGDEPCPGALSSTEYRNWTYSYGTGLGFAVSLHPNQPCLDVLRFNMGVDYRMMGPVDRWSIDHLDEPLSRTEIGMMTLKMGISLTFDKEKLVDCPEYNSSGSGYDWDDCDGGDGGGSGGGGGGCGGGGGASR